MNKLKAVVDRLVRETGLSRTVSRRIANKINRMAGTVNWATPVQEAQVTRIGTDVAAGPMVSVASKPPAGGRIVLPEIPASKLVAKRPTARQRFRPH